ncbi:hypothetical protein [Runella sp.]|uniref:hypothetical protein n=1 Tax=Runella sp. TaxID=1960881 RepID=UPI003D13EF91
MNCQVHKNHSLPYTLILLFFLVLFGGCKGGATPIDSQPQEEDQLLTPTRTVGTGSGNLSVDGGSLGIRPGEIIAITPGTYTDLSFSNLTGTPSQPITLVANGSVEISGGGLSLENVSNLVITGYKKSKNIFFHDVNYRAITLSGSIPHGLTLEGIRLKNVNDYAISYNNPTPYDGTDATAFTDFKLLNCEFENTGPIHIDGGLNKLSGAINNGFCKNPEIAYCTFKNCPTSETLLYMGNVEGCDIHHNTLDEINANTEKHNGIFLLLGNGSVHHNKCTNHQGNFVRFWPFSQGTKPKEVLLYNNIVWNSRKYSALEVQSFENNIIPGISTYCNVKVFNNTVGKMNTTKPTVFVGVVVDVYNLQGGDIQIFNNLSFNQVETSSKDNVWSQQSSTTPSLNTNNRYFATSSMAGLTDEVSFKLLSASPAKKAGLYQSFINDDFYSTKRANPPSIGAVE